MLNQLGMAQPAHQTLAPIQQLKGCWKFDNPEGKEAIAAPKQLSFP